MTKRGIWLSGELENIITLHENYNLQYAIMITFFTNAMEKANIEPIKSTWKSILKIITTGVNKAAYGKGGPLPAGSDERIAKDNVERWAKRLDKSVPNGYELSKEVINQYVTFSRNLKSHGETLKIKMDRRTGTAGRADIENGRRIWIEIRKAFKGFKKMFRRAGLSKLYDEADLDAKLDESYLTLYSHTLRHQGGHKIQRIIDFINAKPNRWRQINAIMLEDHNNGRFLLGKISKLIADYDAEGAYDTPCAAPEGSGWGASIFDGKEPCLIHKYEDGHFWFNRAATSCSAFGEEGRNCGGGNFLLIDLQKKGDDSRSWHLGIDFDPNNGVIHQVLGYANAFPRRKYWGYVKDFVERYNVEHIEAEAFRYTNPTPPERSIEEFLLYVLGDKYKTKQQEAQLIFEEIRDGEYDIFGQAWKNGDFAWNVKGPETPEVVGPNGQVIKILIEPTWDFQWSGTIPESIMPNSEESFDQDKIVSTFVTPIRREIRKWFNEKFFNHFDVVPTYSFLYEGSISEIQITKHQPDEWDEPPMIHLDIVAVLPIFLTLLFLQT